MKNKNRVSVPELPKDFHSTGETDLINKSGAEKLAHDIERGWIRAGHPDVRCRAERLDGGSGRSTIYGVRSNLVDGLPPKGARAVISPGIGKREAAE